MVRKFRSKKLPVLTPGRGYSSINRVDRKRTITVISDIDEAVANASVIVGELKAIFLPVLEERYPGVTYDFERPGKRSRASRLIASGRISAGHDEVSFLLASQFRSYIQPVIIMMAIPFGLIGAIFGHLVMGVEFTIVSIFGIVALSGIVVNDSLILIDFINRALRSGVDVHKLLLNPVMARFRPILLTSVTTVAGLFPFVGAQFSGPVSDSYGGEYLFSDCLLPQY